MLEYQLEKELNDAGYAAICGVDEAGRGPLCGPVVAAACILPMGLVIEGLNDSKKLTPKKRDALYDYICENAVSYCIAEASVEEIDELNILEATLLAMRRAIDGLSVPADFALIDGNVSRDFQIPVRAIVKGDATSPSIAAASILAKVTRDRLMRELDKEFPGYGLAGNKGYGTAEHLRALKELGVSDVHRRSFAPVRDIITPPPEQLELF
jgi:ribonuclease HII